MWSGPAKRNRPRRSSNVRRQDSYADRGTDFRVGGDQLYLDQELTDQRAVAVVGCGIFRKIDGDMFCDRLQVVRLFRGLGGGGPVEMATMAASEHGLTARKIKRRVPRPRI